MNNREQRNRHTWAEQIPRRRHRGPYRDYGWEAGQSALPQFRDPDVRYMPYEREQTEPWQRSRRSPVFGPEDYQEDWESQSGPYVGQGPRDYFRNDERIYEIVCERMTYDGELDAHDIDIEVNDGEVTLTGSVPDRWSKWLAEDIVDSVYGVRDVYNRLKARDRQGTPDRWRDRVRGSSVYPASEWRQAPDDAEAQGMASWGQGERGAEGYDDHGESELNIEPEEEEARS